MGKSLMSGVVAFCLFAMLWFITPWLIVALFDVNLWLTKLVALVLTFVLQDYTGYRFESGVRTMGGDRIMVFFELSLLAHFIISRVEKIKWK